MNLSEIEKEALLRVIESGIDRSTERLAKLSKTDWDINTVSLSAGTSNEFQVLFEADKKEYYGTFFTIPGGAFVVQFPIEAGHNLAKAFVKDSGAKVKSVENLEQTALAESANILVNAVADALADASDLGFFLSPPEMVKGSKTDIMDAVLKRVKKKKTFMMMSYVHMFAEKLSADCNILILLDDTLMKTLLRSFQG